MTRLLVVAFASLVAFASTARAQNAEAEALFSEGDALMKQGKLAEACDSFETSNRLEPRAGTLIRLGECREKNQQYASAWSAYKDALARVKDPKKKDIATARVKELEPRLSHLTVNVADRIAGLTITRNGQTLDSALWNRTLPVNGGDFTIVAQAPGKEEWKTTVKVPAEKGKIVVEVPALKAPSAATPTPTPTPVATPASPQVASAPQPPVQDEPEPEEPAGPSAFTTKRKVAVAVGGVALLAVAGGIVLGQQAKGTEDDAFALCPDPMMSCNDAVRANELIDTAQSRALTANIAFGVAGAAAIGAAVLWFTGGPKAESSVAVRPGLGSLTVVGRF